MVDFWAASPDAPSLGFENVVYSVEHQPLHPDIPLPTDTSEEMVDFISPEANSSNGGPMQSFRNTNRRS